MIQFENLPFLALSLLPLILLIWISRTRPSTTGWHTAFLPVSDKSTRYAFMALYGLGTLGVIALSVSLAGPYQMDIASRQQSEGIDMVILLDVSESMEATDFSPRRMDVAKKVVKNFVERRPNDRMGLVIFSGDTLVKSPLTLDHGFLLSQLDTVDAGQLKQGTAIGMGILSAVNRLKTSTKKTKIIILLTDGDSNVGAVNPITASMLARKEGIKIYPIGIGQQERVVVPVYAKDIYGKKGPVMAQVPSYLNPQLLKNIAQLTFGKAYMAKDSLSLSQMMVEIDALEKSKTFSMKHYKKLNFYHLPLTVALLCFLLLFGFLFTRFYRVSIQETL